MSWRSNFAEWFFGSLTVGPGTMPIDNETIRRAQEQHFLHLHPEYKPVTADEFNRVLEGINVQITKLHLRVKELEAQRKVE